MEKNPSLDARLSDISIGTSAAPTFFPAYSFKNFDPAGSVREFNLVDGGVAANNPVESLIILHKINYMTCGECVTNARFIWNT